MKGTTLAPSSRQSKNIGKLERQSLSALISQQKEKPHRSTFTHRADTAPISKIQIRSTTGLNAFSHLKGTTAHEK
jgi:hypothetical protein